MIQNVPVRTVLTLNLPASLQMMSSSALLLVVGLRFMSWYTVQSIAGSSGCVLTQRSLGTEEALEQTSEMLLHPSLSLQCPESSWWCRFKAIKDLWSAGIPLVKQLDSQSYWCGRKMSAEIPRAEGSIWDTNAFPCQSPWLHQAWAEY